MRLASMLALLVVAGCGDELKLAQNIEDNRVLATRVEVEVDPDRAWPMPGERARVRLLVVDPAERAPLGWALGVCLRDASLGGIPGCDGPLLAQSVTTELALAEPFLDFEAPNVAPGAELLVLGVVCARGLPVSPGGLAASWPDALGCSGADSRATRVLSTVHVASDANGNRNPSLADDVFRFDQAEWTDPGDAWSLPESCEEAALPGLPRVSAGTGERSLAIELVSDDREPTPNGPETLSLASFSTAGELDRVFSYIEGSNPSPSPRVVLAWEAPEGAPAGGRSVRFHFVVRDGRGGVDWATRALCLVP